MSPTLAKFDGIEIYIANLDHPPPHVHVFYAGKRGKVELDSPDQLQGDFSPAQRRKIIK